MRDENPEVEITIFEHIASAYTRFLGSGDFDADARMEAYALLLVRSSSSDIERQSLDLKHLTEEQARTLLSLYEGAARPVTIEQYEHAAVSGP